MISSSQPSVPTARPAGFLQRIAWLLRRPGAASTRNLRQLEMLPLGPRRALYLVECAGERFLITAGGDHVSAPVLLHSKLQTEERKL